MLLERYASIYNYSKIAEVGRLFNYMAVHFNTYCFEFFSRCKQNYFGLLHCQLESIVSQPFLYWWIDWEHFHFTVVMCLATTTRITSSAYPITPSGNPIDRTLLYMTFHSIGPKTEPCGTPFDTVYLCTRWNSKIAGLYKKTSKEAIVGRARLWIPISVVC